MDVWPTSFLCDRAHEWASRRSDGELSELESALLDAHLDSCAACRRFEHDLHELTRLLGSAELERMSVPAFAPAAPGRRRRRIVLPAVAAAAVIVAAGVGGTFASVLGGSTKPQRPTYKVFAMRDEIVPLHGPAGSTQVAPVASASI
jgi:predicted anti-sigma-YlaC factor YlaD